MESASTSWVVRLDQLGAEDFARAGGKAANLGELIRASLPVPEGFCVTTSAFRLWLDGSADARRCLDRLNSRGGGSDAALAPLVAELRERLELHPVPATVAEAIRAAGASGDPNGSWAVRSSATGEDRSQASFAGQHDSCLNVRGAEAVLEAVRRCWISLFSLRAVLYRVRHQVDPQTAAMAVVVQTLIPAQSAGVVFTADPVTGDRTRLLIEGTCGLGEALVAGRVNPDRFVLDKATLRIIERAVSQKTIEFVPDAAGGVRRQAVAAEGRERPCLDDARIHSLGELARRVETHFGCPQDLEWATCNGELFLLQARPITTPPRRESADEVVWTRADAVEGFPDVMTPLSWAMVRTLILEGLFDPLLKAVGLDSGARPWLGLIAGRVYLNLTAFGALLRGPSLLRGLDYGRAFGGEPGREGTGLPPLGSTCRTRRSLRQRLALIRSSVRALRYSTDRRTRSFLGAMQRRVDDLARIDFSKVPDAELADFGPGVVQRVFPGVETVAFAAEAFGCICPRLACAMAFMQLSRRWLGESGGTLAQGLLSGAGPMASAESALDLWRLAAWVRERPALAQVLQDDRRPADVRETMRDLPDGAEFVARWAAFLKGHGHHSRGELDVRIPRWADQPDYVLGLLRGYLRMDQPPRPLQSERLQERRRLLTQCRQRLRSPLRRWLFGFLLTQGQRGLAFRENVKSEGVRAMAVLRRGLLEVGHRLARRGVLSERDDVFFLELPEVRALLTGSPVLGVNDLIAARKAAHAALERLTPPPVVVGQFDPFAQATPALANETTVFQGLAVSPGVATGRARVILHADHEEQLLPGEILVAPFTDPGWTPYFLLAAAVVVDMGGQLSHGSIVAREYGLPAVVNVGPATRLLKTGQLIRVDGNQGLVTVLTC